MDHEVPSTGEIVLSEWIPREQTCGSCRDQEKSASRQGIKKTRRGKDGGEKKIRDVQNNSIFFTNLTGSLKSHTVIERNCSLEAVARILGCMGHQSTALIGRMKP